MKKLYFWNAISAASKNSSKLWKVIKQLLRQGRHNLHINELSDKFTNQETAEELGQYFTDIGTTLADNIPDSLLNLDLTPNPEIPAFEFIPTDLSEVKKHLMSISSAKATAGVVYLVTEPCKNLLHSGCL